MPPLPRPASRETYVPPVRRPGAATGGGTGSDVGLLRATETARQDTATTRPIELKEIVRKIPTRMIKEDPATTLPTKAIRPLNAVIESSGRLKGVELSFAVGNKKSDLETIQDDLPPDIMRVRLFLPVPDATGSQTPIEVRSDIVLSSTQLKKLAEQIARQMTGVARVNNAAEEEARLYHQSDEANSVAALARPDGLGQSCKETLTHINDALPVETPQEQRNVLTSVLARLAIGQTEFQYNPCIETVKN